MFQLVSAVFLRSVIWGLLAVFFKTQPLWRTWQSHRHDTVAGGASPRCVRAWRLPHHGWQCPWSTFYLDIFAEDCRRQSKQVKVRTIVCCLVWSKEIFKFIQRKKNDCHLSWTLPYLNSIKAKGLCSSPSLMASSLQPYTPPSCDTPSPTWLCRPWLPSDYIFYTRWSPPSNSTFGSHPMFPQPFSSCLPSQPSVPFTRYHTCSLI